MRQGGRVLNIMQLICLKLPLATANKCCAESKLFDAKLQKCCKRKACFACSKCVSEVEAMKLLQAFDLSQMQ